MERRITLEVERVHVSTLADQEPDAVGVNGKQGVAQFLCKSLRLSRANVNLRLLESLGPGGALRGKRQIALAALRRSRQLNSQAYDQARQSSGLRS
jgi:hypothetical protein